MYKRQDNKFYSNELKQVFDLCVSCKACASECPSNVDVASLKSEFLYQYKKENGAKIRDKAFAFNATLNGLASKTPSLSNFFFSNKVTSSILKKGLGVAEERSLPLVSKLSFEKWIQTFLKNNKVVNPIKEVYFFIDEFTNYLDTHVGIDAVELLTALNYKVIFVKHKPSGRALLSKGFLDEVIPYIDGNVSLFSNLISENKKLIGVEPSAILSLSLIHI